MGSRTARLPASGNAASNKDTLGKLRTIGAMENRRELPMALGNLSKKELYDEEDSKAVSVKGAA